MGGWGGLSVERRAPDEFVSLSSCEEELVPICHLNMFARSIYVCEVCIVRCLSPLTLPFEFEQHLRLTRGDMMWTNGRPPSLFLPPSFDFLSLCELCECLDVYDNLLLVSEGSNGL